MARAMWSGAISFGLVTVPVKLFSATSQKDIRFHQLHGGDNGRVGNKRVCAKCSQEVPFDQIVKGYEVAPDEYVVIQPEDLDGLAPEASRAIDILDFVPLEQIDPLYFESGYYLVPDKVGEKAYALLLEAMKAEDRVAIARVVMRTKQYLCAIRASPKALTMSYLLYGDEVVPVEDIEGLPEGLPKVDKRELTMAKQLIETLSADFDPSKYKDEYREAVLELIRKRAKGETVTVKAAAAKAGKVTDLAEALEETLKLVREKRAKAAGKPATKSETKEAKETHTKPSAGKRGAK